jgi:hypothetical protein
LRDIRFSQSNISTPFDAEIENNIETSMDKYPFKFFNYENNDLVLLRMFGENDYTQDVKEVRSYNPYVPSLNVVKMNNNCYVSIDNRRLVLIYRQLCLLLSINPKMCTINNMAFKNANDFLRFDLGIPDSAHIYIPCSVKVFDEKPSRKMKTPEGTELVKLNRALGYPEDKIEPVYAGVIWERVKYPPLDKYRDYPFNGYQMFPATIINKLGINDQLNQANMSIYKNNYACRNADDIVKRDPLNVKMLIDGLVQQNIVKPPYSLNNAIEDYNNLETLYYYVANIFINYLKTGSPEFVESIRREELYNNNYKFLPNFEEWKFEIDKIPLYPEKTGGTRKSRQNKKGGTKRKRCKNGTRKNPKTKRCVKKTKKEKTTIFRIGVDFGGVLARHKKGEEHTEKIEEHKNTNIDMPDAVETLKKLKKKGHYLYIVSFCGKKRAIEGVTEIEKAGLSDVFTEQVYIRNPWEKVRVLDKYGCNFMVDDRIDLLDRIKYINPHIVTILFGQKDDVCKNTQHICAENWDEVYNIISKHKQFQMPKTDINLKKWIVLKPEEIIKIKDELKDK